LARPAPADLVAAADSASSTVVSVRSVPWWGVLSAAAAPVLLIGGWTVAAALQPGHFDSVTDTISALAGYGARDRWVMTLGLAGLGCCHICTSLALRPAALPGRLLLATGGLAGLVVAANPLPANGGHSGPHTAAATVSFVALAIWPIAARQRGSRMPPTLRLTGSAAATLAMVGLLSWFGAELFAGGGQVGLSERALAGAEALWPLAVVLTARSWSARGDARRERAATKGESGI
jgi:hypothetical membrane protein